MERIKLHKSIDEYFDNKISIELGVQFLLLVTLTIKFNDTRNSLPELRDITKTASLWK